MKCPTCQREMALLDPFGDGEQYHVCREHKPPVMLPMSSSAQPAVQRPTQAQPVVTRALSPEEVAQLVRTRFPTPIAVTYDRACDSGLDSEGRLRELVLCYTLLVQVTTLILWRDYIASKVRDRDVDAAVGKLRAPGLERWYEAMLALAQSPSPEGEGARQPISANLKAGAVALGQARHGGQQVHQAMRAFRTRLEQQGASWNEQVQAHRLAQMRPVLERALATLSALEEVVLLRDLGKGQMLRLVGLMENLKSETCRDDRLLKALSRSPALALVGTRVLSMHPLLVAPETAAMGNRDEVLIYNGYGRRQVSYTGIFGREQRADTARAFEALVTPPEEAPGETPVARMSARARDTTESTLEAMTDTRFIPAVYLARPGVDDAVMRFLSEGDESLCLVLGTPGSGRASLLCHGARQILEDDTRSESVLLTLDEGGGLMLRIAAGLGLTQGEDLDGALDRWADELPEALLILIDAEPGGLQLNAPFNDIDKLALMARQANERVGRAWLKIVVTADERRFQLAQNQWTRSHDTPFFDHTFCFAHFDGALGQPEPCLKLPRFNAEASAKVYAWTSHVVPQGCPTPWNQLPDKTRRTLNHPMMIHLHHLAFGGVARPEPADTAELWQAYFDRLFDRRRGGELLEEVVFGLVDRCLEQGHNDLSEDLLHGVRSRWMEQLGGDPNRIAAALDPIERLENAGLLRHKRAGHWAFTWEGLTEQLYFRALLRRSEWLDEETLQGWLKLPHSALIDDGLVLVGQRMWSQSGERSLGVLMEAPAPRGEILLVRALALLAPTDDEAGFDGHFRGGLEALTENAATPEALRAWKDAMLWGLAPLLEGESFYSARRHALEVATSLLERLAVLEPEVTAYLRDLAVAYKRLGDLDYARDPEKAQLWFERGEDMAKRLSALEAAALPNHSGDKRSYLLDLTSSYKTLAPMVRNYLAALDSPHRATMQELTGSYHRLGEKFSKTDVHKARSWFEKGRVMAEHLMELEPENLDHLGDLTVTYQRLSNLDHQMHPDRARQWTEKRLTLLQRLGEAQPEAIEHQRAIASCYNRLGELDEAHDPQRARAWFEKAMALREQLVEAHSDSIELLQALSSSYHRMGRIDGQQDPEAARAWFERDLSVCARMLALEPDNLGHQRNLSIIYFRLGELALAPSVYDASKAQGYFEKDVAISEKLAGLQPDNAQVLEDLLTSCDKLIELDLKPNPPRAHAWALKSLDAARRLRELQPAHTPYGRKLAGAYKRLGTLDLEKRPARAIEWFELQRATLSQFVQSEPNDPALLTELAQCYKHLGELTLPRNPDTARGWLTEGIEAYERLSGLQPKLRTHTRDTAALYMALANLDKNDRDQENTWLNKALALLDRHLEKAPGDPIALMQIVRICERLSELDGRFNPKRADTWRLRGITTRLALLSLDSDGDRFRISLIKMAAQTGLEGEPEALQTTWLERSIDALEQLIATDRKNASHQRNLAVCRLLLGDQELSRNPDLALRLFNKGLARIERLTALEPDNTTYLHDLAQTYRRLTKHARKRRPNKARNWNEQQIGAWERLINLDPNDRQTIAHLADAYDDMGHMTRTSHPSKAAPWFGKAVALRQGSGIMNRRSKD